MPFDAEKLSWCYQQICDFHRNEQREQREFISRHLDVNGDGVISIRGISSMLRGLFGRRPSNSCENPDLCEKMGDIANFVYAASTPSRREEIDCELLKDRISWFGEEYGEDSNAIDIVDYLSEAYEPYLRKS